MRDLIEDIIRPWDLIQKKVHGRHISLMFSNEVHRVPKAQLSLSVATHRAQPATGI